MTCLIKLETMCLASLMQCMFNSFYILLFTSADSPLWAIVASAWCSGCGEFQLYFRTSISDADLLRFTIGFLRIINTLSPREISDLISSTSQLSKNLKYVLPTFLTEPSYVELSAVVTVQDQYILRLAFYGRWSTLPLGLIVHILKIVIWVKRSVFHLSENYRCLSVYVFLLLLT